MSNNPEYIIIQVMDLNDPKKKYYREIGVDELYWESNNKDRLQYIQDWIQERGNPQHETTLELIAYEINEDTIEETIS